MFPEIFVQLSVVAAIDFWTFAIRPRSPKVQNSLLLKMPNMKSTTGMEQTIGRR
jgi:hypothetical protein